MAATTASSATGSMPKPATKARTASGARRGGARYRRRPESRTATRQLLRHQVVRSPQTGQQPVRLRLCRAVLCRRRSARLHLPRHRRPRSELHRHGQSRLDLRRGVPARRLLPPRQSARQLPGVTPVFSMPTSPARTSARRRPSRDALFCGTVMPDGSVNDRDCGKATACCQAQPAPACQTAVDCADQACATKACQNGQCVYTPVSNGPSPNAQCTTHCCEGVCCGADATSCNPLGLCCVPNCAGRECGPDGCGGTARAATVPPAPPATRRRGSVAASAPRRPAPTAAVRPMASASQGTRSSNAAAAVRPARAAAGRTRVRAGSAAARPTAPASPAARTAAAAVAAPVVLERRATRRTGGVSAPPRAARVASNAAASAAGSRTTPSAATPVTVVPSTVSTISAPTWWPRAVAPPATSPANGCADGTCCGDPAALSCGDECCGPPATVCNDDDGGCSSGCGSSGSPCCQDSQCCDGVCCEGTCCGEQEVCRNGRCVCVPKTCAELGRACGTAPDGCGGTLSCGTCGFGDTPSCRNGVCASCAATCPSTVVLRKPRRWRHGVLRHYPDQLRGRLFLERRLRSGRDLHCDLYDQRGRDATESDHDDREHLWRWHAGNVRRLVRVLTAGGSARATGAERR